MTFAQPAALWLLAAVPLVWAAHLAGRTNFNRRQRWLQAAIRSLLLSALALAVARPVLSTVSSRDSIVYLVDVSHSVSSDAVRSAAGRIDALNGSLRPAHSRIVAFGRTSRTIADTGSLRKLVLVEDGAADQPAIDRRGTDLQGALEAARAELAPGHVPRIVLFSDGRPTLGAAASAVARLAAERIPVSVEPLAARSIGDTWIAAVDVPEHVSAGASFAATVTVGSQRRANGSVSVSSNGALLAQRAIAFPEGTTTVSIDVAIEAAGPSVLEAKLDLAGDPLAANNTMRRAVWTAPSPRVLYVEGVLSSARYLAGALQQSGYDVTTRPPSGLPATADELDAWDAVVLSDVSRTAMPARSMAALTEWVERRGGGLLVAGGESVFGEGGYRKSELERLTPVTFERKDEPEVALILVLDRSWSMAGPSIELCKAAAQAAVDVLADEQSVGILTFNDSFNWDVTLRNVGTNRDEIRRRIAAIAPGGHTLIYPAIEQAYRALKPASARAKHVLLLSDGRSYPANYEELIRQMVADRMTVSSIAVGPGADPELLANIAKWGRGRSYTVADARELPQIFVKEAKDAATPAFDEEPITPVVKTPAFLAGVDLTRMPQLKGRTATVLKDTALEIVATDDENPLLAFWPAGAGRVAVFASDVKDRWAANWVRWKSYAPFFTSVVRAVERRRAPALTLEVAAESLRGGSQPFHVAIEARDRAGQYRNLLRPVVDVRSASGASRAAALRQVAAGRYETTVLAAPGEALTFTVASADAPNTGRHFVPDPAAEYRFHAPDESLLRSIASATGGVWLPTTPEPSASADGRTERRPLTAALLLLALLLWFADVLFRRLRVFEPR